MPENDEIKVKQLEFPLDWVVPDHIVARYATNMVVQHGENEFFISFFEVKPPLILGNPQEVREQMGKIKALPANCVAQVIVSDDKMKSFIDALSNNYKKFLEANGNIEAEE